MKKKADILIYIALAEELKYILKTFTIDFTPEEDKKLAITLYWGEFKVKNSQITMSVILVPAGQMGNTHSSSLTSVLIDTYKPKDVIVLGIAGSLSNDLTPGDVFVPTRVVEYLANSSAVGEEVNKFITSGNHFVGDPRLVNRLQNLSVTNEVLYKSWLSKSGRNFKSEIPNEIFEKLKSNEPGSSNFGKAVCHTTKSGEEPTFRLFSGSINSIDPYSTNYEPAGYCSFNFGEIGQ